MRNLNNLGQNIMNNKPGSSLRDGSIIEVKRNYTLGKQITNLRQLDRAICRRQAVICPKSAAYGRRHHPASFMLFQQGSTLLNLFKIGMYIYIPYNQHVQ